MKVTDREYTSVEVKVAKTPTEYDPEIRIENGVVWVKAKWEDSGTAVWVRADSLRGHREAKQEILSELIRWVWRIGINTLEISKAEMKRRLIAEGLISK